MENTTTQTPAQRAASLLAEAVKLGFRVSVRGDVITVTKTFEPGDRNAYILAESDAYHLLGDVRMVKPGSTWGTTSDGVGGHAGLTGGHMRLNRSGCEKRLLNAVAKLQAAR